MVNFELQYQKNRLRGEVLDDTQRVYEKAVANIAFDDALFAQKTSNPDSSNPEALEAKNNMSVAHLILDFFHHYAFIYNQKETVISIKDSPPFQTQMLMFHTQFDDLDTFKVVDPFDSNHNPAHNVKQGTKIETDCFENMAKTINSILLKGDFMEKK